MDKKLLKIFIKDTTACKFKQVQNSIESRDVVIPTQDAISLVISCCTACSSNMSTPDAVSEEDLRDFLKFLKNFIVDPTDKQVEKYLQSVFHILKLISAKRNTEVILQFEDILIPSFHPKSFEGTAGTIYRSLCSSIHNMVASSSLSAEDPNKSRHLLGLVSLLTRMHSERVRNQEGLITAIYNATLILIKRSNVDNSELYKFYCHALKSITVLRSNTEDLPRLFKIFTEFYLELYARRQFPLVLDSCERLIKKLPSLFSKDIRDFCEILSITKWLVPESLDNESVSKCYNSLKRILKSIGKVDELLKSALDLINSAISAFTQFYKDNKGAKIGKDETSLNEYFKLLTLMAQICSKVPATCSCGCLLKTDFYQAFKIVNHVPSLATLYVIEDAPFSVDFLTQVFSCFKLQFGWLVELKAANCQKLKSVWNSTGTKLYNIGIKLHEKKDEFHLKFLRLFVHFLYGIEGVEPTIFDRKYFGIVFSIIADHYYERKMYEKVLIYRALSLTLSVGDPKRSFAFWANSKAALRKTEGFEELTIPAAIEKYKSEIETFFPGFELGKERQIEMLILELNQCKSQWWSKVAMMTAYKRLTEMADPLVQGRVFVEIWGKFDYNVHETLPDLLNSTLEKFEKTQNHDRTILAHLCYLSHKYRVNGDMINVCEEIDKNMTIIENASKEPNTDPNNECDVVSSYECLRLNKYAKMMKNLNRSLIILSDSIKTDSFPNGYNEIERIYGLLKDVALEYRLHSHLISYFRAWELALKIARIVDNKSWILECASFILDFADVSKEYVKDLIEKGDSILEMDRPNFEITASYNLSKTKALLKHDVDKAHAIFQELLKERDKFDGNFVLSVLFTMLHHKFVSLPCKMQVEGHPEEALIKIHSAYNRCFSISKSMSAYEMALIFEVREEIARFYSALRMPREVRCYVKEILVTSQKMVLPFRTIPFLYYLAIADLFTRKLDDCRVKISGISDILNLTKSKSHVKSPVIAVEPAEKFDRVMDSLNFEFKELMLDVPNSRYLRQSPGSPVFQAENFKFPSSFCHESACDCFQCVSPEYFDFVLKRTFLQALLNVYDSDTSNARGFFAGGIKMYKFLKEKQNDFSVKLETNVSRDLIPDFRDFCFEIYCKLLLEYCNTLLRSRSFFEANEVNSKLISYLKPQKLNQIYLYNESLLQRLNILEFMKLQGTKRKEIVKMQTLSVAVNDDSNAKTPETKISKVSLIPRVSPDTLKKPPKRTVRKIKFDLSDGEDEGQSNSRTKSSIDVEKTPLPHTSSSKIKIYSEVSSRRKRAVLSEMPPPPKCDLKSDDSVISISPDAKIPPSSLKTLDKIQKGLSSKTRLLTGKLKTPKPKTENDENSKIPTRKNSESALNSVRKSRRNVNN